MKGMALAQKYFREVGQPMIEKKFPVWSDRICAGLVGEGSECFGFDDIISRDHDWGPGFCIWLTRKDFTDTGAVLQDEYLKLPGKFLGFERLKSSWGKGRVGVFEINRFYYQYTGLDKPPVTLSEWRRIPEQNLAACTNGKVFCDSMGEFTKWRNILLDFYPEDIRLKKIACRCMLAAQSGQYNFPRLSKRSETVAAQQALSQFITHSISLAFLLKRQYMPFYKWSHHALKRLPQIGEQLGKIMIQLVKDQDTTVKIQIIEEICAILIQQLKIEGLSSFSSDFLLDHGPFVQACIRDEGLKVENIWIE